MRGQWGAVLLHLALILILGPWGMKHSANVLIWNGAMLAEAVALFWPRPITVTSWPPERKGRRAASLAAAILIWAAAILPLGERSGWWDTWPSFAVYSSSNETIHLGLSGDAPGLLEAGRSDVLESR